VDDSGIRLGEQKRSVATGDWIQICIAIVLTLTLGFVVLYVRATKRIAKATFQPVLTLWLDVEKQELLYWNMGLGPALNIGWQLGNQTDRRISMGIRDDKGKLDKFKLPNGETTETTLVACYEDVDRTRWRSTLKLHRRADGTWENGRASYEPTQATNWLKRSLDRIDRLL
jgi:hypothetical protein